MLDFDLYAAIAVFIVASVNLLKCARHELRLKGWLSPLNMGWILAGLSLFLPQVQKGTLAPLAAVYFLFGALMINTLVLSFCSKLPNEVVEIKSPTVEMVGGVLLQLIGTGLWIVCKDTLTSTLAWVRTWLLSGHGDGQLVYGR